jgi:hypothetical protein
VLFPARFRPTPFTTTYRDGRQASAILRKANLKHLKVWERIWVPGYAGYSYADWDMRRAIQLSKSQRELLCLAIEAYPAAQAPQKSELEALMVLSVQTNGSRLYPWTDLIYVEYLITAPHNRPPERRLPGLGRILVRTAMDVSRQMSFAGRIGLHSKPEAEEFYAEKVGLVAVGREQTVDGLLLFFELDPR